MNRTELEGKWNQLKGEVKQKYGKLTDDDVTYTEGKFDEMIANIQEKVGVTKEKLEEEFKKLMN